jgi:hypothetical protein
MITICNNDIFTTDYAKKLIENYTNTTDINQSILNSNPFNNQTDPFYTQSIFYKYSSFMKYNFFTQSFIMNDTQRKKLGSSIDDFLVSCSFGLIECNKTKDFDYTFSFLYGNCYRFNSGKDMNGLSTDIKSITQPGYFNGSIFL